MTATWNSMTDEARALTAATFEALTLLDGIHDRPAETDPQTGKRCGFTALYAYACDPATPMSAELAAALCEDAQLAADLRHLLAKECLYQTPRQAAASSGGAEHRQGPGFTLDIRPSQSEASQVYVVIHLNRHDERPEALFVSRRESDFLKEPLPAAPGDTFQLLFDADAAIVRALRDPQSEVFLR